MRSIGTIHGKPVVSSGFRTTDGRPIRTSDAAIATGGAFLVSELEKREPRIREPLTTVTYHRDIPMKSGGGWVEFVSALSLDFGVTGGSGSGVVNATGANAVPVIQANIGKDIFKAHEFATVMRVNFVDMQRGAITGRSLDQMLTDGIRLAYDKHMDANVYKGIPEFGTTGILNNANVVRSSVATGAGGYTTFASKTPDEILYDINSAITAVWGAAGWDLDAIPNHIIMPFEQYNYLATTKVSAIAEKTILTFILENNIAAKNGKELVIGATAFCKGAGQSSTDRMAVYVHNDRFIACEELVPLSRTMTQPNVDALAYDSVYMANVSEAELFYTQTIQYFDGI